MEERNIISAVTAAAVSGFLDFIEPLKWFMLAAVIIVLADLRFGIRAARYRGENIRFSRAGRRTLNKMVDYICWIFIAGAFGKAFGVPFDVPVLPALVLLVIFGFEINSCYCNYFEVKGKKVKIDIFKWFAKKTDIIEMEDMNNENK